jgi:hypothetical protein
MPFLPPLTVVSRDDPNGDHARQGGKRSRRPRCDADYDIGHGFPQPGEHRRRRSVRTILQTDSVP